MLRQRALRILGREPRTSRVTGMCLLMIELSMTQGRPLSCRVESWEGSWKMNTVMTSVAKRGVSEGGREGGREGERE